MRLKTLPLLRCPRCSPSSTLAVAAGDAQSGELRSGELECRKCHAKFPVLQGVALLVRDVGGYLIEHAEGISRIVPDPEIPRRYLSGYLQAREDLEEKTQEWDLESDRVNSLYVLNHYLTARERDDWWQSKGGSPVIQKLIQEHWDQGPFAQIRNWSREMRAPVSSVIELGCGVGGLFRFIQSRADSYLGVDSAFLGIAIARHLTLGLSYNGKLGLTRDLLLDPEPFPGAVAAPNPLADRADFVVGEIPHVPVDRGSWSMAVSLGVLDMLEEPELLPKLQAELLAPGGTVISSCPYCWLPRIAEGLRKRLSPEAIKQGSATVAEGMYRQAGFEIEARAEHVPWLFFKHLRQLEVYSTHLIRGKKR